MSRYFGEQQDYIDALQVELDKAKADEAFITGIWPEANCDRLWAKDSSKHVVRLRGYGYIWGEHEHEHMAWIVARRELEDKGVLSGTFARPENGQNE